MLKPYDLVVLFKVACWPSDTPLTHERVGAGTGVSTTDVFRSLRRSSVSGLYLPQAKRVSTPHLVEFVVHAVKYVFPAKPGALARGIPTGIGAPTGSAPPFFSAETWVWPSEEGQTRGVSIAPLHPRTPGVAPRDLPFYALLCLTDALRAGDARQRAFAAQEIERRLRLLAPPDATASS